MAFRETPRAFSPPSSQQTDMFARGSPTHRYHHQAWPHWPVPADTDKVNALFATENPGDVYARLYQSRQEAIRRHQTEIDELGARYLDALNNSDLYLKKMTELHAALKRRDEELAALKAGGAPWSEELACLKTEVAEWKRKFTSLEDLVEIRKDPNRTVESMLVAALFQELQEEKIKANNWKERYSRVMADGKGSGVSARIAQERSEHDLEVQRVISQMEMLQNENRNLNDENTTLDRMLRDERRQRMLLQYPEPEITTQHANAKRRRCDIAPSDSGAETGGQQTTEFGNHQECVGQAHCEGDHPSLWPAPDPQGGRTAVKETTTAMDTMTASDTTATMKTTAGVDTTGAVDTTAAMDITTAMDTTATMETTAAVDNTAAMDPPAAVDTTTAMDTTNAMNSIAAVDPAAAMDTLCATGEAASRDPFAPNETDEDAIADFRGTGAHRRMASLFPDHCIDDLHDMWVDEVILRRYGPNYKFGAQ